MEGEDEERKFSQRLFSAAHGEDISREMVGGGAGSLFVLLGDVEKMKISTVGNNEKGMGRSFVCQGQLWSKQLGEIISRKSRGTSPCLSSAR